MATSELVLVINGVDFIPFVEQEGISWKRNDVDSSEAGEMADGTLRRDRVIMRRTMQINLKSVPLLTSEQMSMLQQAIFPEFVAVKFNDPLQGEVLTRLFYSNNVPATVMSQSSGKIGWKGFSFPLIEQGVPGEGGFATRGFVLKGGVQAMSVQGPGTTAPMEFQVSDAL